MNRRKSREREEMEDKKRLVDFFARKRKTTRKKKPNRLQKLFSFFGSDSEQTSPVTLLSKTEFKNKQITLGSSKNVKFLPALEKGGLITEPTEVLAGEAGPEAIIPLDQLRDMFLAERRSNASSYDEPQTPKPPELALGTSSQSKMKINGIVMDRNQDGVITREEAAEARSLRGSSDPLTERVVKAENIKRTQKMAEARGVSVEDLTTGKSDYGNEVPLDLNKDGIVTPEERQEANRRRDEMDLGTIRDRGDEVRESRRNLETEKSLYGGMTREQAVLRFGEGAVRDREDIVMDNATGPQGTEDIRQIERVTERNRAGDRDRKYVDDSRQQGYEDSSNRLRDEKRELRDMTLEMNRVSKGAGEFTQVTPSDIADARGRFNQGQREIENQMNEGEVTPNTPTQDVPTQDVTTQDVPEKPLDPSLLAQGSGGAGGLPGMVAAAAMSSNPSTEKPSEEIVPRSESTEVDPLKKLQKAEEEDRKKRGEPVRVPPKEPDLNIPLGNPLEILRKAEEEDRKKRGEPVLVPPKEPDLNIPLGNPLEILRKAEQEAEEERIRKGLPDPDASTEISPLKKLQEANAGRVPPKEPDLNIPLGNPLEILRKAEEERIKKGLPDPDASTEVDPLDKLEEKTLAPAPKLITKRDPSSLPPSLRSRRGKPPTVPAIKSEKDYREDLEGQRNTMQTKQEQREKEIEERYGSFRGGGGDPKDGQVVIPKHIEEELEKRRKEQEGEVPKPADDESESQASSNFSNRFGNFQNPTALAAAQRANPPMMSPSAFAPTKTISGAAEFSTDFGILSLLNQTTPMWRTT